MHNWLYALTAEHPFIGLHTRSLVADVLFLKYRNPPPSSVKEYSVSLRFTTLQGGILYSGTLHGL